MIVINIYMEQPDMNHARNYASKYNLYYVKYVLPHQDCTVVTLLFMSFL